MVRFIVLTFAFVGLGFYELSGGSDFVPAERHSVSAPMVETQHLPEADASTDTEIAEAASSPKPKPTPSDDSQIEAEVVLASVPTTRRLVGTSIATPAAQQTKLGPEPSLTEAPQTEGHKLANLTTKFDRKPDFRRVTGNRVNMRNGPGTQYSIVGKLLRNDEVEVLRDPGSGWVKLQDLETGRIGWMSARLLSKSE